MVFDKTGNLATTKRHDYLPFGEEIGSTQGLRSATQGYGTADDVRQKFTSKERDNETGLDYFGARYYANTQGRFVSADTLVINPALDQPQLWNKYSYSLNNPLVFYDPDGKFPYSITIRSFAPPGSFQGTGFNDDRRGFTTDQDVSSKIRQSFTADPDTANVWGLDTSSSGTTWNGYGPKYSHPIGDISNIESSRDSGGHGSLSLQSSFSGSNPWFGFPMPEAPPIVVRSTISLQENKDAGTLSVSMNISSKAFPATEAMIADKSGTKVFLAGAAAYGGGKDLYNRSGPVWKINMTILINGKGQFQGVMFAGKKYSIAGWNQLFTSKKAGPFPRNDLRKL